MTTHDPHHAPNAEPTTTNHNLPASSVLVSPKGWFKTDLTQTPTSVDLLWEPYVVKALQTVLVQTINTLSSSTNTTTNPVLVATEPQQFQTLAENRVVVLSTALRWLPLQRWNAFQIWDVARALTATRLAVKDPIANQTPLKLTVENYKLAGELLEDLLTIVTAAQNHH